MPDLTSVWFTHKLQDEKDLANLAPKGSLVTAKAIEGSVVEIGKTQKASRDLCVLRQPDGAARLILPIIVPRRSYMTRSMFIPTCVWLRARHQNRKPRIRVAAAIIDDTYTHMKTTLNIDDTVMAELKREAARQSRTMSELVETALRLLLRSHREREKIGALPSFRNGGTLVDIADRDALYQAMEGR
jgi:Arc/MetJ family transcription regulator